MMTFLLFDQTKVQFYNFSLSFGFQAFYFKATMRIKHVPTLFTISIPIAFSNCDNSNYQIYNFIHSDTTIRPLGNSLESSYCAFKRWNDYALDHNVWLWPCDSNHVKYQWSYDSTTKQIKSIGSEIKYPESPFCWYVKRPSATWAQQVRIKECDENDSSQKFSLIDGRIYLEGTSLCVGWETTEQQTASGISLTIMKCYSNQWGEMNENGEITSLVDSETNYRVFQKDCPMGQFKTRLYNTTS